MDGQPSGCWLIAVPRVLTPATVEGVSVAFDPGAAYRLHPNVAVRPEPFGALVYHYGNRKLVFLKSPRMVAIVKSLDGASPITEILLNNGVPVDRQQRFVDALSNLFQSDMIVATNAVRTQEVAHVG
jgi:mycofactocin biosynthesis protein MftB